MTQDINKGRACFNEDRCWSRLFALSLHLYPAEFREVYGNAMTCVFEEKLQEVRMRSGYCGVLGLLLHTLADLAKSVAAERVADVLTACGMERESSIGISLAVHGLAVAGIIWVGIHTVQPAHTSCDEHEITRSRHPQMQRGAAARKEKRGFAVVVAEYPSHSGQR